MNSSYHRQMYCNIPRSFASHLKVIYIETDNNFKYTGNTQILNQRLITANGYLMIRCTIVRSSFVKSYFIPIYFCYERLNYNEVKPKVKFIGLYFGLSLPRKKMVSLNQKFKVCLIGSRIE